MGISNDIIPQWFWWTPVFTVIIMFLIIGASATTEYIKSDKEIGKIMATKAIKLTRDNVKRLEGEYDVEEGELTANIGYWMIVQFGSTAIDGFLSEIAFIGTYSIRSKLENGWVDVVLL